MILGQKNDYARWNWESYVMMDSRELCRISDGL